MRTRALRIGLAALAAVALAPSAAQAARGPTRAERAAILAVVRADAASPAFGEQRVPARCWRVRVSTEDPAVAVARVPTAKGCRLTPRGIFWLLHREAGAWATEVLATGGLCWRDADTPAERREAVRDLFGEEPCRR